MGILLKMQIVDLVTIESFFENGVYESFLTLFEMQKSGCFTKEKGVIKQYYYSREDFEKLKGWRVVKTTPINLYEEESIDKILYLLERV